ncbi:MAG: DUF1553 domain-containing protein [Planctomycetaceae bacterium]|nr:DUF1553 domain-containing protein [Planctomycetaceae bacterium]
MRFQTSRPFFHINAGRARNGIRLIAGITLLLTAVRPAFSQDHLSYNEDVRPILAEMCFTCHGPDSAARKADLRIDQREAAIETGTIVPGKPDESELINRIMTSDPELIMPPPETKKKLDDQQKALLSRWIAEGAEYQKHWSFLVPEKAQPPQVRNTAWPRNDIDRFVLRQLESKGLSPAPEANPRTLFRRLHLDITGLPPQPADVDAFVADYGDRGEVALSDWIDRLLQNPSYGEHRARYWLDAARYGDTHGLHFDNYREMWPYRDWVIRAYNANMPFDEFTVEQLAGDLLPDPTTDQLIATGFQRCNITTNEGGTIDEENLAVYAADRVQTFGWVYLGLTTNCGQCHNHKFDPFSTRDYYSLAAYFRNTTQNAKDGNVKDGRGPVIIVPSQEDAARWNALPHEIASAIAARNARKEAARADYTAWLNSVPADALTAQLPQEGLTVHVPLNEGAGIEVANACDGPETFRAIGEVTWVPEGKLGPAPVMKAGGTFDLGTLGDFEKDQAFSYGAWIRTGRNGVFGGILARMDEQGEYRGWDLWQNDRSLAVHMIQAWPDNGMKVVTQDAVLTPGEWQHVFVTYDGSATTDGIQIYVNGTEQKLKVERNTLKPDATIRTTTPLRIGQRSTSQVFDGGAVQDVRIYSRQLQAGEVKAIADVAALQAILMTATEQRTPEQQEALYDYYLATVDAHYPALAATVTRLEAEKNAIQSRSPVTHVQEERKNSPPMAQVLMRGEYDKPQEDVAAAPPAALHPLPPNAPNNRLGLAQWLVDPANPLTSRVTVNRMWQQIFGQGIVRTTEDFGVMGAPPTNRELLDWLAVDFQETGWSVKSLHRSILLSDTWQRSGAENSSAQDADPDNLLQWKYPTRRLEAESIRDATLFVSGRLNPERGGSLLHVGNREFIFNHTSKDETNYDSLKRSVYLPVIRNNLYDGFSLFDYTDASVPNGNRTESTVASQSLFMMNSSLLQDSAKALAELVIQSDSDDSRRVQNLWARCLCRPATDHETERFLAAVNELQTMLKTSPAAAPASTPDNSGDAPATQPMDITRDAWAVACQTVLMSNEFLYVR